MVVAETSKSPQIKVQLAPSTITESTNWTVAKVRCALDAHEAGDFTESARLAAAFDRDDRIAPCLDDRANALVGAGAAEFSLEPADDFVQRSKATIARLDWYQSTCCSSWLRRTLKTGIKMGVSVSAIPWERTKAAWIPREPIHWPSEHVWWSESESCYMANTMTGAVPVRAGDPNWFLFTPGGAESWMAGAVRGLGMPYIMRTFTPRDWSRFNERHGLPIIVINEPGVVSNPAERVAFYQGIKRMGSSGIIRAPQGKDEGSSYGVDLLEAKARSFDSFDKFLDRLNVAIAIYLKGQNLTTEVSQGAYASTGWHMRIRKDYAENDADSLSEAIRAQLLIPFGRFNLPSWDDRIAPWPTWNLEIPEDQKQVSEGLLAGAKAIELLLAQEVPVDWDLMMPRLGIPLLKGAKMPTKALKSPSTVDNPPEPQQ